MWAATASPGSDGDRAPAGIEALTEWMRSTKPDYDVRCEAGLRGFFLWTLTPEEAVAHLRQATDVYRRHLAELADKVETTEWTASGGARSGRLTLEMGLRYYRMLIDWAEWASSEIAAGALEDDGPQPGSATAAVESGRKKVAARS